jgi:hypothetical protein
MAVGFTTTDAINAYHHWCCALESWSGRGIHHYVIKFLIDLRQVGGFLRVHQFLPPIKLTPQYSWNIVESGIRHHKTNKQTKKQTFFWQWYFLSCFDIRYVITFFVTFMSAIFHILGNQLKTRILLSNLIILVFCVVLLCVYVLSSVLWCPLRFPHQNDVHSSLPTVVCRRAHVLYTLFVFVCA